MKHSLSELDEAAIADLISDAEVSENQAKNGPFYRKFACLCCKMSSHS